MHPGQPYRYPPTNSAEQREKAGLMRAGKWAIWLLIVVPAVVILACCGLCVSGGVIGAVTPTPTTSGY